MFKAVDPTRLRLLRPAAAPWPRGYKAWEGRPLPRVWALRAPPLMHASCWAHLLMTDLQMSSKRYSLALALRG